MARLAVLALYIAGIVANLGAGPAIVRWVGHHGLGGALRVGIPLGMGTGALGLLYLVRVRWRERRVSRYLALALLAAAVGWLLWILRRWPAEQMHLVQYGLLGPLAVWALAPFVPGFRVVPAAALLAAWVGLIDELIQGWLPTRYYDARDVWVNIAASALGIALCGLLVSARRTRLTRAAGGR
ncbi:MAG: VanZ family protein [Myxococcales bacterium]|nr:VanZ family protein [Myxococcales bacterium]